MCDAELSVAEPHGPSEPRRLSVADSTRPPERHAGTSARVLTPGDGRTGTAELTGEPPACEMQGAEVGGLPVGHVWDPPKATGAVRIVCFGGTDALHNRIKDAWIIPADILIHCGNFSISGTTLQVKHTPCASSTCRALYG